MKAYIGRPAGLGQGVNRSLRGCTIIPRPIRGSASKKVLGERLGDARVPLQGFMLTISTAQIGVDERRWNFAYLSTVDMEQFSVLFA